MQGDADAAARIGGGHQKPAEGGCVLTPPEEPQEAGGMKYGPIETILATPAMKEELQQKGRIEVLCSEGFQTLRAVKEQTPFWMDGIYVRVIARNERATVVLLEEECVSVPSTGSDVGTKSVHLQ